MGFGSIRHAYANGHCNCDSDGYFYCHSYGNCGANRFFATEQSDRNSDRDGYSDSYGNGDIHCYLFKNSRPKLVWPLTNAFVQSFRDELGKRLEQGG